MGNGTYNVALEYFQRTEEREFQRSCATRELCVYRWEHSQNEDSCLYFM